MRYPFSLLLVLPLLGAALPATPATKDFFEAHPGLWSFAYLVTAIVSLLVSGVGLYLIWGQLKAGRQSLTDSAKSAQAAADAARISYAATRPWLKLSVSKAHLYFHKENLEEVGCQLNYIIKNVGNTPAIDVRIVFKPVPVGHGIAVNFESDLAELKSTLWRNPRVLFPDESIEEGLSRNFPFPRQGTEEMLGFKIVAAVIYKAALDGETYWTPAVLGLQHETPPADRVYRFYRGMGNVPCLTMLLGDETPQPT